MALLKSGLFELIEIGADFGGCILDLDCTVVDDGLFVLSGDSKSMLDVDGNATKYLFIKAFLILKWDLHVSTASDLFSDIAEFDVLSGGIGGG